MRVERRGFIGSPPSAAAAAAAAGFALRGIVERGKRFEGKGVKMGVRKRRVSETQIDSTSVC